jgi:hypothetical protein
LVGASVAKEVVWTGAKMDHDSVPLWECAQAVRRAVE